MITQCLGQGTGRVSCELGRRDLNQAIPIRQKRILSIGGEYCLKGLKGKGYKDQGPRAVRNGWSVFFGVDQPAHHYLLPVAGFFRLSGLAGVHNVIVARETSSPQHLAERIAQQVPFLRDVLRQSVQCRNTDQREKNKRKQ